MPAVEVPAAQLGLPGDPGFAASCSDRRRRQRQEIDGRDPPMQIAIVGSGAVDVVLAAPGRRRADRQLRGAKSALVQGECRRRHRRCRPVAPGPRGGRRGRGVRARLPVPGRRGGARRRPPARRQVADPCGQSARAGSFRARRNGRGLRREADCPLNGRRPRRQGLPFDRVQRDGELVRRRRPCRDAGLRRRCCGARGGPRPRPAHRL
jgi:hypothetical protein